MPKKLAVVTSAPKNRPGYMRELLEVIALPSGMTGQFTYRQKWISEDALAFLDEEQKGAGLSEKEGIGLLFFAELDAHELRVYPLRIIRNVFRPRNEEVTESNQIVPVVFKLGALYGYPSSGEEEDIKYWTTRLGNSLKVRENDQSEQGISGQFVSLIELDEQRTPRDERDCHHERWTRLTSVLSSTALGAHALMHIEGVFERRSHSQRDKEKCLEPTDNPINGYTFNSAMAYEVRIRSRLPAEITKDFVLNVKSHLPVITVSYPRFQITGIEREDVVVLQLQRINERIEGDLSIALEKEGNQEASVAPRIAFSAICTFNKSMLLFWLFLIGIGVLLANVNAEFLQWSLGYSETAAKALSGILKGVGLFAAGLAAFWRFRKIPG